MIITRRAFTSFLALTGVSAFAGLSPWRLIGEAQAQSQIAADLARPSPLGDMVLGADNASVTIVEYASMTCPHCASFTEQVFPKLKTTYIDTGKVRFIFREFPLDLKAAAGSMLARCIANNDAPKFFAAVDTLFKQQNDWALANTVEALKRIGKQAGLSDQAFEACLSDQKMLDAIKATQEHAADKLKVTSTPYFFVNGTPVKGDTSFEAFEKLIKPLLKA